MGNVTPFPMSADAAWERYETLAKAALADPKLTLDRRHVEATVRAHKAFCDAFGREAARG